MTYEIEHPAGTDMDTIREREHEFKKDMLAKSMGISREHFNDLLNSAKEFFELNKKDIVKNIK